jgi:hypothetical protein
MWQAKSVDFQRTPEDKTPHNHRYGNLKSYIAFARND